MTTSQIDTSNNRYSTRIAGDTDSDLFKNCKCLSLIKILTLTRESVQLFSSVAIVIK